MFSRIVVAVGDGSDADRLEAAATRLAAGTDAEVLLVHVAECRVCCGGADDPVLHQHEHDLLRLLVENLSARGIRARSERRVTFSGRPAEHLLNAALEGGADLLIVAASGSRGLRGRSQMRVIQTLLRRAPCPVFVLPPEMSEPSTPTTESHGLWRRRLRRRGRAFEFSP